MTYAPTLRTSLTGRDLVSNPSLGMAGIRWRCQIAADQESLGAPFVEAVMTGLRYICRYHTAKRYTGYDLKASPCYLCHLISDLALAEVELPAPDVDVTHDAPIKRARCLTTKRNGESYPIPHSLPGAGIHPNERSIGHTP